MGSKEWMWIKARLYGWEMGEEKDIGFLLRRKMGLGWIKKQSAWTKGYLGGNEMGEEEIY